MDKTVKAFFWDALFSKKAIEISNQREISPSRDLQIYFFR